MFRIILYFAGLFLLLSFTMRPENSEISSRSTEIRPDTVPIKVDDALIRELTRDIHAKTWRDSGYYFQLERVRWQSIRLGATMNGDMIMMASFTSADPSSLNFRGQAVFRFDPGTWPADITPFLGMQGEATLSFPQDVLFCPSPSQEVGLGQNDPYFPLYLTGEVTGVYPVTGGEVFSFRTSIAVQLRDLEIII